MEVDDEKAKTAGKKTESAFAKRSKKRALRPLRAHSARPTGSEVNDAQMDWEQAASGGSAPFVSELWPTPWPHSPAPADRLQWHSLRPTCFAGNHTNSGVGRNWADLGRV